MASRKPNRAQRELAKSPGNKQSVDVTLDSALSALNATRHALEDWISASTWSRRETAVNNFVINARRCTAMLNRLKNAVTGYNDWWSPWVVELEKPLSRFFNGARVNSEHHFTVKVSWLVTFTTPPAERFSGSVQGQIELNDEDLSVAMLVPETGERLPCLISLALEGGESVPAEYRNTPPEQLMSEHLALLERVVSSAVTRFAGSGALPRLRVEPPGAHP